MRPIRAAATALVASLALSACNGGDDPADPKSSSTPSASTTAPSTAPPVETPTEPALPKAATKATEAGARAFITYYWDLINYAQVTGDVKRLKSASGPNCDRCSAGINGIREVYRAGGHLTDGGYRSTVVSIKEVNASRSDLFAFESKTDVSNGAHVSVNADGSERSFGASTVTYLLYVLWVDERWRLDVMERS